LGNTELDQKLEAELRKPLIIFPSVSEFERYRTRLVTKAVYPKELVMQTHIFLILEVVQRLYAKGRSFFSEEEKTSTTEE